MYDYERTSYYAMELKFPSNDDDLITELYDHLNGNGYHFFLTTLPGEEDKTILLISTDETGYIDTVLDDRGIEYTYFTE